MNRKPIYGTDFSQPLSKTVEELRSQISHIRGQLYDIGYSYPAWKDRVESVQGLLTCGLVSLYGVAEEMRKHELQFGHRDATKPTDALTSAQATGESK